MLQAVVQKTKRHSLVQKQGLFFCQGFKDLRMARPEIFMTNKSEDIYFSGLPHPFGVRKDDGSSSSRGPKGRGDPEMFIQDESMTSYFSKRYPVSMGFLGSLPKNLRYEKKLCGVPFCYEKGKEKSNRQDFNPLRSIRSRGSDRRWACYKAHSRGSAREDHAVNLAEWLTPDPRDIKVQFFRLCSK